MVGSGGGDGRRRRETWADALGEAEAEMGGEGEGGGGVVVGAAALRFFFSLFLHRFLRVFYLLFFPPLSLFFSSLLMFVQIKL